MYEPTGIGRFAQSIGVRQANWVCFSTGGTGRWIGVTEAARSIAGEFYEALEMCPHAVQATVHEMSGVVVRRHNLEM
eukprot:2264821-Pleurochrysis_carterae.AAC.6